MRVNRTYRPAGKFAHLVLIGCRRALRRVWPWPQPTETVRELSCRAVKCLYVSLYPIWLPPWFWLSVFKLRRRRRGPRGDTGQLPNRDKSALLSYRVDWLFDSPIVSPCTCLSAALFVSLLHLNSATFVNKRWGKLQPFARACFPYHKTWTERKEENGKVLRFDVGCVTRMHSRNLAHIVYPKRQGEKRLQ